MNKNVWVWVVGLLLLGVSSVTAYSTYCIVLSNNTICFNDSGITGVSNITATNINASDVLNAPWLVATDQRYNNTALILAVQQSVSGNSSALLLEIQNRIGNDTYLNNLKLNITDQRFNDSALISAVQQSVSGNATSLTNEISARQSIGNWSNDKNSYNTTVQLLTLFYLQSNPYNFLNSTTIPVYNNLSMATVVSGVGNWSGDKSSYNTTSELNTLFYLKSNPFGFYNSSTIPAIGTNMSLVVSGVGNWSADKNSYNTTSENYNIFLNITDQRYNDTVAINNVQSSVSGNASLLTLEIQSRQGNDSSLLNIINLVNDSRTSNDTALGNRITVVNSTVQSIGNLTAQSIAVRDPTGFKDRTTSTITFNHATRNLTFVGTYDIYINGTKYTRSNDSVIVPNVTQLNFIYYDDGLTLKQSTSAWEFESIVQGATVYYNNISRQGIIGDERHGIGMDWRTHEYLHETVGARYASGLAGVFNDTNISIGTGEFYDEDNEFEITSALTQCNLYYRNGTNDEWVTNSSLYFYKNATNLYYDNGTALVAVGANQYVASWIFITNNPVTPLACVVGQRTDATIADARANNNYQTLTLDIPVAEAKLLFRVILRNDVSPYEEALDFRSVSTLSSGNYLATDHGTLSGLTDDDHTQYLLRTDATVYNDSAYITAVNNSLVLETQSRVGNDSLKANLVGNNAFVGTNEFTGTTYINTTLNIKDGAGANGTTIQGNTIWTGTLFVVNISQATIVPAINVNGSYLPLLSDTFYLGNNTRVWKEIWGTTLYEGGVTLNSRYNETGLTTALYTNLTNIQSSVASIGNWSADKSSYATVTMVNLVNDSRTSNDTALGNRITVVNSTVQSIGNWTNDKPSYKAIGTFTTHSAINITGGDINMSNTGSCLYLPGGGRICGNTTTVSIIAP